MLPYITLFGREVSSYSLMALIGCAAAFFAAMIRCRRKNLRPDDQLYFFAFILIFSFLGAKAFYVLLDIPNIIDYREEIFSSLSTAGRYFSGGFVFYGGLMGGLIGAVCYAKFFTVNAVRLAENFIVSIPLFHFFGRIGCFLAGCCYGIRYSGIFSVTYTNPLTAPDDAAHFPVQLLEAALNLMIFFLLLFAEKRMKKPLQNFGLYLILYGTARFLLEFLRGDEQRGFWGVLSVSQWLSIAVIIPLGLYMFFRNTQQNVVVRELLNGRYITYCPYCGELQKKPLACCPHCRKQLYSPESKLS